LLAEDIELAFGERTVLRKVNARFERGWTAIVGLNGAGKSSLLRVLAGLLAPQQGQVRLDGQALHGAHALPGPARGRRIAWLAQASELSGELTLRETVALGRLPHLGLWGVAGPADEAAIDEAMALTECRDWQHRRMTELSGGERQRGLLARALATGADVLLLDEPTTHLDPPHQIALARLVRRLSATHTVVTVMHDLTLALAADRLLLLDAGQVRASGRSDDEAVHRALCDSFGQTIVIRQQDGQRWVTPRW
jgi:iron complex transport system ATP-binding protein